MAITFNACSNCHHRGRGCLDDATAAEPCSRYEHRLQWLTRQIEAVRRAELATRLLLATVAVLVVFPIPAWLALNSGDGVAPQAHVPAVKVLAASAVRGVPAIR